MLFNNISSYIEGNINYFNRRKNTPEHIKEQILYRMLQCNECTTSPNKKCVQCGCSVPKMFFAPNKQDSKKRWPPYFENASDWVKSKSRDTIETLKESHPKVVTIYNSL